MSSAIAEKLLWKLFQEIQCPSTSLAGRVTNAFFNRHDERVLQTVVNMLDVKPNDKVLQIDIGTGDSLLYLFEKVERGKGVVYGTDCSDLVVNKARRSYALEMRANKIFPCKAYPFHLPLHDCSVDAILHVNRLWYFPLALSLHEFRRVLKPGGRMLTALSLSKLNSMKSWHLHKYLACSDPLEYMTALEKMRFENVHFNYHQCDKVKFETVSSFKAIQVDQNVQYAEEEKEFFEELIYANQVDQSLKTRMPIEKKHSA